MNIIELKNIFKAYKLGKLEIPVLFEINMEIKKGDMLAIMGPSGSGKSTLMNIIGLLDRPSSGDLILSGNPISLSMSDTKLAKLRNQKIGFVFQTFNLLPKLSALSNVLMPTIYNPKRANYKDRAIHLLKGVGLEKRVKHKPTELSGGEKQRVAIARALINDPDIILADEPTGNLDSKSGEAILEILQKLHKKGKTVIVISHDAKIAKMCPKIIHIFDGKIKT